MSNVITDIDSVAAISKCFSNFVTDMANHVSCFEKRYAT